jgi:hypothetical protein
MSLSPSTKSHLLKLCDLRSTDKAVSKLYKRYSNSDDEGTRDMDATRVEVLSLHKLYLIPSPPPHNENNLIFRRAC